MLYWIERRECGEQEAGERNEEILLSEADYCWSYVFRRQLEECRSRHHAEEESEDNVVVELENFDRGARRRAHVTVLIYVSIQPYGR
jgi:hypothetical protein